MKYKIFLALLCLGFTTSAFSAPKRKVQNSDWGNSRIIFAAQFDRVDAFNEGIAAGGTVLGAEKQCLKSKVLVEKIYGEGACERIAAYAPDMHAEESFVYHAFWHITVPISGAGMTLVSGALIYAYKMKYLQNFYNKHLKIE